MNGAQHRSVVLVFAAAMLILASIFLYRIRPLAGVALGSTAIALAVLAHLGILAVVVGPLLVWRRRRRR